jgi:STE24 endopeptidase
MTASQFALIFLAAVVLSTLIRLWLSARQVRHVMRNRDAVPDQFAETITLSSHQRAADYTVTRHKIGLIDLFLGVAVALSFTLFGGLQWLSDMLLSYFPQSPLLRQVLLVGSVVLISGLIDLPLSWYRQFRIEEHFGFNRMSLTLWLQDMAKGVALGIAIGLPLLAGMIWLMERAGTWWWFAAWIGWMIFNLLLLWLFPTVIAPLFNKFEPLADQALRERIEALLTRCGFRSSGVMVMDGSKRSSHGNAYFTGFGGAKRIVFFDTLIKTLNPEEIEAVLAHELGHFKRKHVTKRIVSTFFMSLLGLALLGYLAGQVWFYQGLGISPADPNTSGIALILFFIALPFFTFLLQPLSARLSRKHEFEADAFAAEQTNPQDLVRALIKLYKDNASTLTPDPIHSAFYDSHPPALIRVQHLQALTQ